VERHFPRVDYDRKARFIGNIYRAIGEEPEFAGLPEHLRHGFGGYFGNWRIVPREEIARTISHLPALRDIPNFYVRNLSLNVVKDAIHMQFNCDGTHIVSSPGYLRFIAENV